MAAVTGIAKNARPCRPMAISCILFVLVCYSCLHPDGVRAESNAQPPPSVLQQILKQSQALPGVSRLPWMGRARSVLEMPIRNDVFADLMTKARREDQVLPLSHALFDPETAAVGLWHSAFYLDNYGTALFLAAPFSDDRVPVLLVHGINGSARDFTPMVSWLQRNQYQPVYFAYPSGMDLDEAADQLGKRLQEFVDRHDMADLVVIGHSMGGIVVKALLDRTDVSDTFPGWRVFISISSPFGGVETAHYADRMPRRPPAWDDLGPDSPFIRKVREKRLPSTMSFYLLFGARSGQRYLSALGNNDGVLTIASMCDTPLTASATDVFGFYEDHTSILAAPLMLRRVERILATE